MERDRNRTTVFPTHQQYSESRTGYVEDGLPAFVKGGYYTISGGSVVEHSYDIVGEKYRSRIDAGEIVNNPMRISKTTQTNSGVSPYVHNFKAVNPTYCPVHNTTHYQVWENQGKRATAPSPTFLVIDAGSMGSLRQSVIDLAVVDAHARIDTSEILALATVAESQKTVSSMLAILSRVYTIVKDVKRLRLKSLAGQIKPKELADRYMEMRYAIRPLMYDARGICRAMQKNAGSIRKTYRAEASDSMTSQNESAWGTYIYLVESKWKRTATYTVSAKAGVMCDVTMSDLSTFGVDQLLETAWELLPFSFIIDWFSNAGNWIAAHTPNVGVSKRASWVTVKSSYSQHTELIASRSIADASGYLTTSLSVPAEWHHKEELVLERVVSPALPAFAQGTLSLDVWKLTDLGIIIKKMIS